MSEQVDMQIKAFYKYRQDTQECVKKLISKIRELRKKFTNLTDEHEQLKKQYVNLLTEHEKFKILKGTINQS